MGRFACLLACNLVALAWVVDMVMVIMDDTTTIVLARCLSDTLAGKGGLLEGPLESHAEPRADCAATTQLDPSN